jgi:hypothetical protein
MSDGDLVEAIRQTYTHATDISDNQLANFWAMYAEQQKRKCP